MADAATDLALARPPTEPPADGRRLRAARSRDAVVDALLALYDEGHLRPGAALIAERAGVSQRSVFRHFEDLEAVVEVAVEHQWARIRDLFEPPSDTGSLDTRIRRLVEQRLRIYDAAGPTLRAGRLVAPESAALAAVLGYRRALLREQVERQFAPELDALARARRSLTVDALEVVTGLEQVEALRIDRGMSTRRAAQVLTLLVRSVLAEVAR